MVGAPPRPLRLAPRPLGLASSNFASGGNYELFQRSTVGPPPLPRPPGIPSAVIWLRPLEATMQFSMVLAPPQVPEAGPQAPEFGLFEFCVWRLLSGGYCPLLAPCPSPGPKVALVWSFG